MFVRRVTQGIKADGWRHRLCPSAFCGTGGFVNDQFQDPRSLGRYGIIRLHLSENQYEKSSEAPDMPLGQSRIGGPIIDLPEGFEHPPDLFFVAQSETSGRAGGLNS
jgi:hypothetical protein